ncbi:MAG: redoxin domain-containing protein [Sediminibacterium sp.]|nr:redoxin domain-containing protein [Sediminibacterium sp.]
MVTITCRAKQLHLTFFLCLALINCIVAQTLPDIKIGAPAPDAVFQNLHYSENKVFELNKQRGKYVILDFFSKYCTVCFLSLPKIDSLQKVYKDKIQFVMIGPDEPGTMETYQKFHNKLKLSLPVAIVDRDVFKTFGVHSVPHLVWIDRAGIIKGITISNELTRDNLELFLRDGIIQRDSTFLKAAQNSYDNKRPLLLYGNGGEDSNFAMRSLFSVWKPGMPLGSPSGVFDVVWKSYCRQQGIEPPAMFQTLGSSITRLYNYAYWGSDGDFIWKQDKKEQLYGNVWPKPVFEIRDTTVVQPDYKNGKNVYNYSIATTRIWKDTTEQLKEIMRNDLRSYFGYGVDIQFRSWPIWKLIVIDSSRIPHTYNGESKMIKNSKTGIHLQNLPISSFVQSLSKAIAFMDDVVIDSTGIDYNLDIKIDAILTNFEDINAELKRNGFALVRSTKIMQTLVIKDDNR